MCLLLAAYRMHPRFDLVVAANRDEYHARPTARLQPWPAPRGVYAGRDLAAGGTWLGVDSAGRFAAVTNFRDLERPTATLPSRGRLVLGFLEQSREPARYLEALEKEAPAYAGFNLLVGDRRSLWYASNRSPDGFARELPPGIYGLSNDLLDTPWPKVLRARRALTHWLDRGATDTMPLRQMLADTTVDGAGDLRWPASSGPFISHSEYGTRSSTWLTRAPDQLSIGEEGFAPLGRSLGTVQYSFAPA